MENIIPGVYGKNGIRGINSLEWNMIESNNKKFCDLHDFKGHSTNECVIINKLKKRMGKIREQSYPKTQRIQSQDEVKNSFYLFFNLSKQKKNPFIINGKILGRHLPILIDTGADLSPISQSILPKNIKIWKTTQQARAANGGNIPIVGKLKPPNIQVEDTEICIGRVLITSVSLPYLKWDLLKS